MSCSQRSSRRPTLWRDAPATRASQKCAASCVRCLVSAPHMVHKRAARPPHALSHPSFRLRLSSLVSERCARVAAFSRVALREARLVCELEWKRNYLTGVGALLFLLGARSSIRHLTQSATIPISIKLQDLTLVAAAGTIFLIAIRRLSHTSSVDSAGANGGGGAAESARHACTLYGDPRAPFPPRGTCRH